MLNMQSVINLASMRGAEVLFGYQMSDVEVTGITIMEAPDIAQWMQAGQILLCSSYSLPTDSLLEFITALAQRKIGALMVKIRNMDQLPKGLVEFCKEQSLNLIKIPENKAYTEIMYEVMGQLFNVQLSRAGYFKQYHDIFMRVALEGQGMDAIARVLGELVKTDVVIYDINGRVLAGNVERLDKDTQLEPKGEFVKRIAGNIAYYDMSITVEEQALQGVAPPIKALDRIKAYLFIKKKPEGDFSEFEWIAIENAISVLNLEITKQLAIDEIEQKFRNDLLDDLLSGNIHSESVIFDRARVIGWDFRKTYQVVVVKITHNQPTFANVDSVSYYMRNFSEKLVQAMREVADLGKTPIFRIINDTIIALVPYDLEGTYESNLTKINQMMVSFGNRTQETSKDVKIYAGVGASTGDIFHITKSYNEAVDSIRFGSRIQGRGNVYDFKSLGVYRLLCQYEDKEQLRQFIPNSLKKLMDYDKNADGALLNTLETFLACDCNANKASKELFVHHKTLIYRINKIKSIIDCEALEGDLRLELQIAFKILHLLD